MGALSGAFNLGLRGLRRAIGDVVADRAVQQRRILGHHADMGAQAFLRHLGDVLAVDQDMPALEVVEAQEEIDDGRLAGARRPDQADLFTRPDGEGKVVDRGRRLAIAKGDVVEADFAVVDNERLGRRRIGDAVRAGNGVDAVVDRADVLEQAGHLEHDPARHVDHALGQGADEGNGADGDGRPAPQPDGERAGGQQQAGIEQADQGLELRHLALLDLPFVVIDDQGVADIGLFTLCIGEQLDGLDVGVAVDDTADQGRARFRRFVRRFRQARHEKGADQTVEDHPHQERQHQAQIGGDEQVKRAAEIDQHV